MLKSFPRRKCVKPINARPGIILITQRVRTLAFSMRIRPMSPIALSWDETILKLATPKLGSQPEDWLQLGLFVQSPRPVQKVLLSALESAERRAGLMYFIC